jgi:hypothetical protein
MRLWKNVRGFSGQQQKIAVGKRLCFPASFWKASKLVKRSGSVRAGESIRRILRFFVSSGM